MHHTCQLLFNGTGTWGLLPIADLAKTLDKYMNLIFAYSEERRVTRSGYDRINISTDLEDVF